MRGDGNFSARFRGDDISRLPTHAIIRRGISWVPQGHRIFPTLTVAENLTLAARNARPGPWTLQRIYESFSWMKERERARGGYLSGGEQQMLAIARALIQNPDLVLMDEPTAGMSPAETTAMIQMLRRLPREICLLIVEHDMDVVFALADSVTVLHMGEVLAEGTPAEVHNDERVLEVYLHRPKVAS